MAKPALAQRPLPGTKLLLVEDNASDAYMIGEMLAATEGAAYEIHHVTTQAEAIAALAEHTFDACLLDLSLPDTDGFSALLALLGKAPDLPVLILTGDNDMALAKRAVSRGAQDYLLKDDLEKALLSRSIGYAIVRKNSEKSLFQRANYDPLTGLTNRTMFESILAITLTRAARTGSGTALLFIDLDRFKSINDNEGHEAGDAVLKTVSERLQSVLRAYDTAARFGGDEFAVLLEAVATPRDAAAIAQKIISAILAPIPYRNKLLEVGASIGIAFTDKASSPGVLLQYADTAMYNAKKDGGSSYRFYAPAMHGLATANMRLEDELKTALHAEQLRLFYQPYMNVSDNTLLGVEALLRWEHPQRGMLAPDDFLGAAEAARIMADIGAWTALRLRRDIAFWSASFLPPFEVSLNLSASQVGMPSLIDCLSPLAQKHIAGGHRLAIEIPEEALGSFTDAHFTMLHQLHAMGIALQLDHFGRGSLSLPLLLSLPFTMLKLDLTRVQDMVDGTGNDTLISAAILLAHQLGKKVCAVGVEIEWQRSKLTSLKCDALQGFLYTPPMDTKQLAEWISARPQAT